MTYTFEEFVQLMGRAGNGLAACRYTYEKYLKASVVFSVWLYWFRRTGD